MSQASARPCSRCGMLVSANQRSCLNCGAPVHSDVGNLRATPGQGQYIPLERHTPYPSYFQQPPQTSLRSRQTPLPYSQTQHVPGTREGHQYTAKGTGAPRGYQASQPGLRSPVLATPANASSKMVGAELAPTQIGCGIGIIALLVIILFATGSYLAISFIAPRLSGTSAGITPTSASVTTTPINATLTYAGVQITLVDVRQAASFPEDANLISAPGEVRLDIEERNTLANAIGTFTYSDVMHIILPTSKSVAPVNADNAFASESAVPRTNWLDFPVPTNTNVSDLLLRLGRNGEARMDVLLRPNVDVSRYQPKTVQPHSTLHYRGLDWTITTATLSWSVSNQQASAGTRFVALTLKADNPTSQAFNAVPGNYMRLKAGSTTNAPTPTSTFPPSVGAKATGTTGTAVFLVPQDITSYTFILVADPTSQVNQASANFQIQ